MSRNDSFGSRELSDLADDLRSLSRLLLKGSQHKFDPAARGQYWVLGALVDGPRRMTEIATCAHVSQASLTGIVDRLEEHDLVRRVRQSEDRRVVEVEITEAGRAALAESRAEIVHRLDEVLAPLAVEDRRRLADLVAAIVSSHHDAC